MSDTGSKSAPLPALRMRVVFDDGERLGPGKADLLEHIERTGSISAAGREMGMSYKRAWMLVDQLNRAFVAPLVKSERGGASGGGATLTATGQEVLALYRTALARAEAASEADLRALLGMRGDIVRRK